MPPADWLLVQTATSVSYDGKILTLKGISPGTIMFADRPQRMTANIATQALIDEWNKGQRGFEKDPPNANLSLLVDGKEQNTVVELTNPKLSGDTLTYDARLLYGEPAKTSGPGTLFIDWWEGPNGGASADTTGPWHTVHCEPSYGRYPAQTAQLTTILSWTTDYLVVVKLADLAIASPRMPDRISSVCWPSTGAARGGWRSNGAELEGRRRPPDSGRCRAGRAR